MTHCPPLTLPGGNPARTPGAVAYVTALQRHGRARSALGQAVEAEREAFKALVGAVARGAVTSAAVEARRRWREARRIKAAAAAAVTEADELLEAALKELEAEQAASYREVVARG